MIRWLLALLLLIGAPAAADEFKPAYLQLTERGGGAYDVLWKLPALDETTTLKLKPVFPPGTSDTSARQSSFANGAAVVRWRIAIPGGLNGKTIAFPDLAITRIDILVRVARADGTEQLGRALQGAPGFTVTASPVRWEVVQTYSRRRSSIEGTGAVSGPALSRQTWRCSCTRTFMQARHERYDSFEP